MLTIKGIYDAPSKQDGHRILVDRLWPRGISRERAALYRWAKEIAPSTALRQELHQHADSFAEFSRAYITELNKNPAMQGFMEEVAAQLKKGNVTLLYAAHDEQENHARVLKSFIEKKLAIFAKPVLPK